MVKLIRFIALISQSIFIQFVHLFGLVAFILSAVMGYFRLPSWTVPIASVIFGVVADKYIDESAVSSLLEKAASANQRGGFLIVVFLPRSAMFLELMVVIISKIVSKTDHTIQRTVLLIIKLSRSQFGNQSQSFK